jgi:hypothetical protein
MDAHHVAELRRLATIGYVHGIKAKLNEVAIQHPESRPLVDSLTSHVREFDLKRFIATLETVSVDHHDSPT